MSPEEEWALMNVANFDQAIWAKIKGIRSAMNTAEVKSSNGLVTNVQGVVLAFKEEASFLVIDVGKDGSGKPQATMKVPAIWLEG